MRREMQTAQLIAEFPLTPEAVKVGAERAPGPDAAKAPAIDHSAATTPFRPRYCSGSVDSAFKNGALMQQSTFCMAPAHPWCSNRPPPARSKLNMVHTASAESENQLAVLDAADAEDVLDLRTTEPPFTADDLNMY